MIYPLPEIQNIQQPIFHMVYIDLIAESLINEILFYKMTQAGLHLRKAIL